VAGEKIQQVLHYDGSPRSLPKARIAVERIIGKRLGQRRPGRPMREK